MCVHVVRSVGPPFFLSFVGSSDISRAGEREKRRRRREEERGRQAETKAVAGRGDERCVHGHSNNNTTVYNMENNRRNTRAGAGATIVRAAPRTCIKV